jgi:hypothetical protein
MRQKHIIATAFEWWCEQYLVTRTVSAIAGIAALVAVILWVTH